MDPLRIIVRVACSYVLLLILLRISGKHTVKQSGPVDFTLVLILGDLVDDVVWADVSVALFAVASGMLLAVHTVFDMARYRAASLRSRP